MTRAEDWNDARRDTLRALCDTLVAAVDPPAAETGDPTGFWGRTASDLGVPERVADYLDTEVEDADRDGMLKLLDLLRATGLRHLPLGGREAVVRGLRRLGGDVAAGIDAYVAVILWETYGVAGPDGHNPMWDQVGYPGPPAVSDPATPSLEPATAEEGADTWTLEADVCVVGSGSGGGVVAGVVAEAGRRVVVLEAGDHLEGATIPDDEMTAYRRMYWRKGLTLTDDGTVAMLAGATLGGGSTINWQNCVPPPPWVRAEWAGEHGLKGLDGDDFERHLAAVQERVNATDACSDRNGPNERLREGADAHGWAWHTARRNTDPDTYTPETASHVGFGDRTGSKQGTLATYLKDAADHGAEILVRCRAERVLVEGGRAVGVAAVIEQDGLRIDVTVRARHVVVACGALETPALLLRSGIGGPAVGHHLRLHPVAVLSGYYGTPQRTWWGAPQTVIVDEFADLGDGHGFLVETPHHTIALAASSVPWTSARRHKLVVGRGEDLASFIAVTRDHGAGRVTVDDAGEPVVSYPLDHPGDQAQLRRSLEVMARLHEAAGARLMVDLHPAALTVWRRGDDLESFIDEVTARPIGARQRIPFSAHQMGTARMGTDPSASVADPDGQLHDTAGVWIGDTSAFPSAVESNPMITCMALARRTAHALLAADS